MSGRIFSFHFPLWYCCFPHHCCSFFCSWPSPLRLWPGEGSLGSRSWVSVSTFLLLWCSCSRQTPSGRLVGFFLRKAAFIFSIAQFLPVLRIFTLETNPKQSRHGPWWRWCGGVFLNVAEAIRCFHWLRCLQLLSMELFILITSLVFFHHVHVWLDWYGCVCVCVCVLLDVSTGKHNSVNYYRITSIFIAFFCLGDEF